MDRPRRRRHGIAVVTTLAALVGAPALVAPASADPSPQGVAHRQKDHHPRAHQATPAHHGQAKTGRDSSVSLPRPNDFQAQSDPDGSLNGGVDQPGGRGGLDPTSQDGNNGSGNDADCEDDNNGVGVPGHCKDRTPTGPAAVPAPSSSASSPSASSPSESSPSASSSTVASATVASATVPFVLPPSVDTSSIVAKGASAPPAARSGVLPATGAAQNLGLLALVGVAAVALGSALVLRRRRATA